MENKVLNEYSTKELKMIAKSLEIEKFSIMSRDQLIEAIAKAQDEKQSKTAEKKAEEVAATKKADKVEKEPGKRGRKKVRQHDTNDILKPEYFTNTTAGTVRNMLNAGFKRAEIADAMNISYQMVREIHLRMVKREHATEVKPKGRPKKQVINDVPSENTEQKDQE